MKRGTTWFASALLAILAARQAAAQEGTSGAFGTALEWEASAEDAAARAKKDGKLVLLLHISGHFEDPGLT